MVPEFTQTNVSDKLKLAFGDAVNLILTLSFAVPQLVDLVMVNHTKVVSFKEGVYVGVKVFVELNAPFPLVLQLTGKVDPVAVKLTAFLLHLTVSVIAETVTLAVDAFTVNTTESITLPQLTFAFK